MSKEFNARPYQQGDEEGIVDLMELVFNGWPHLDLGCSPLDHWRWKYEANPIRASFVTVAESGGEIIGCHHAIPVNIRVGGELLPCTTSADYAVHPDFRELGISKRMGIEISEEARARAGVKFDYHITGNPILIRSFEKRKPRFPFEIVNLVRIRDIDEHLRRMPVDNELITRIGFSTLKMLSGTRSRIRSRRTKPHGIEIDGASRFDERADVFWDEAKHGYDYVVERRRDYFNWRFCDPRAGEFVVKIAKEGERMLGYSVLRINRYNSEYPVGYIVELLALSDRLDAAELLAADAVRFFDDNSVNIVIYQAVKGHDYEEVLKGLGFLDSRIPLHMFYTSFVEPPPLEKLRGGRPERIYVSWGDHDVLPVSMPNY